MPCSIQNSPGYPCCSWMMCRSVLFHFLKNSYLEENPSANFALHRAFLESVLAQEMLKSSAFSSSQEHYWRVGSTGETKFRTIPGDKHSSLFHPLWPPAPSDYARNTFSLGRRFWKKEIKREEKSITDYIFKLVKHIGVQILATDDLSINEATQIPQFPSYFPSLASTILKISDNFSEVPFPSICSLSWQLYKD